MKFTEVHPVAERLLQALRPFCWSIEIAGSIRRRRPECNNIDIVCVPRRWDRADSESGNEVQRQLVDLAARARNVTLKHGTEPDAPVLSFLLRGILVRVTFAEWNNLASLFVYCTGSREHNEFIARRAAARGLRWVPRIGLIRGNIPIRPVTETMFYAELGLPFISPEQRELAGLKTFMDDEPKRNV